MGGDLVDYMNKQLDIENNDKHLDVDDNDEQQASKSGTVNAGLNLSANDLVPENPNSTIREDKCIKSPSKKKRKRRKSESGVSIFKRRKLDREKKFVNEMRIKKCHVRILNLKTCPNDYMSHPPDDNADSSHIAKDNNGINATQSEGESTSKNVEKSASKELIVKTMEKDLKKCRVDITKLKMFNNKDLFNFEPGDLISTTQSLEDDKVRDNLFKDKEESML